MERTEITANTGDRSSSIGVIIFIALHKKIPVIANGDFL